MTGRLATDLGYTPDQIDAMTLDQVEPIFEHWKRYPPLRDLVAAFIGFKPKAPTSASAPSTKYMNADDMRRIMAQTGGKIPGMRTK